MLLHSYTFDSLSKSQELSSAIESATTTSQIASACASIDSFLHSHSPDQSRHFFSLAFPTLISKLFGFHDPVATNAWIHKPELAQTLFSLLSPAGTLAASIAAVDRLSLVKYLFPVERLPHWTRSLLLADANGSRQLSDLCPSLFKPSPSPPQVQLNVFEYFFFWLAYYPVSRAKNQNPVHSSVKRAKKFRLEDWAWASSIPGFSASKRCPEGKPHCDLYTRLLCAYLRAFVTSYDLAAHQPYRTSILHYGPGYDASVAARAEFVVHTLIHFWLVDNDFSPLPRSLGVSFPAGEAPPPAGLAEVVSLFVRYLNLSTVAVAAGDGGSEGGSPRWRSLEGGKSKDLGVVRSLGCWNFCVQRPLYRFLLRTFLFCPMAASVKNVSQVLSVWVGYLEPWTMTGDEFSNVDGIDGEKKENSLPAGGGFSPRWQDYVLSNYLYYSSLVMHFIGFAHRFLHSDVEIIVQMVLKVLDTLTSSKELVDLLKTVDSLFHSIQAGSSKPMLNNLYRYVPTIREQLQDWEDGLCETDADGSFLPENWNKDLRLFADGEDGGQQLLQLFILRAEAELQAISGDNIGPSLQCIDSLKAKLGCLFDGDTMKSSICPEPMPHQQSRDEIFKPRRVGYHASSDVKYKGDWMRRPISNDEIAWLAKMLIRLSDWLNESLGLNQAESNQVSSTVSYVEVSTDVAHICGPSEAVKVFLCTIGSWFLFLGAASLGLMRKYGLRVNLRILASKKVVMVFVLYVAFGLLKKLIRAFHGM
uniref:Sphingomyelin phosphodiesterase 4 n=1 Tax=Cajanus cajan TaxID=3821 RepID=A0A151SKT8_CAJCA|nr:Sphingomyelin phosphodiesterase 4 [Cajanus cajan]